MKILDKIKNLIKRPKKLQEAEAPVIIPEIIPEEAPQEEILNDDYFDECNNKKVKIYDLKDILNHSDDDQDFEDYMIEEPDPQDAWEEYFEKITSDPDFYVQEMDKKNLV